MAEISTDTRAERLLTAADDAARLVRRIYITFLLLCVTVAVIIWSTTDEQLFRGSPLTLPQVNIAAGIDVIYGVVHWVILIFHFNLLLLLMILAQKLRRLEDAYANFRLTVAEQQDFGVLPFPFPFSHMILGVMRPLVEPVVWATVIVPPLVLLLWAQIRFLPLHDETVIWSQRAAVVIEVIMLWYFWPAIMAKGNRPSDWWVRLCIRPVRWALAWAPWWAPVKQSWREATQVIKWWRLIERWRGARRRYQRAAQTVRKSLHSRRKNAQPARGVVVVMGAPLAAVIFSIFIVVLPGDEYISPLTTFLFDGPDAPFHRNLRLERKTLVAGEPSAEVLVALRSEKEEVRQKARLKVLGLNLANRDLRSADFSNAILVRANLQGANLSDAVLIQTDLTDADLGPFDITEGGQCLGGKDQELELTAFEQEVAGIRPIRKPEGTFCLTDLRNSKLGETKLAMARLPMARLHGTNLEEAGLQSADLRGARLEGAVLTGAKLQGANLANAQLQGAALIDAELQGADLSRAQLQGANLRDADLRGADLFEADLRGADLSGAVLRGADLTGAKVGGAKFDSVDLSISDLREVDRKRLTDKDYEELKNALEKVVDDEDRLNIVLESLEGAIDQSDNMKDAKAAKYVLCDFGPLLPDLPCPSKLSVAQYDRDLVDEVLRPLGCGDADIARGLARRAVSAPSKRYLGPLLAEALLDPKCKGGAALPEETKAELRRIASRR